MKIISIVWYKVLPPKFGGQKGIACFNNELAKHHPLVCLCAANNEPADDLLYKVRTELPVSKWQFILPSCWKKITNVISQEKATHIILEHPYHGLAAIRARKATGAKLIVHSHNIEAERFREMGKWWWQLLYLYEKWVHRKADLSLFKTETDMSWAIQRFKLQHTACMVIPYGVTRPVKIKEAGSMIRQRHDIAATDKILLFAATLDYKPNAIAVEHLFNQIAPEISRQHLSYRIIICGRNNHPSFQYLKKLSHPAVILAGEVEDIENYFSAANVFINPVESGGGMQTKNIDALSYELNVICFDYMLAGIEISLVNSKVFPIAKNDWKGFVATIHTACLYSQVLPEGFFHHYSFTRQTEKLAARLNSL
ncbi:MAG TPA: glycosyltransferase [Chitinophagaceae bacterium]